MHYGSSWQPATSRTRRQGHARCSGRSRPRHHLLSQAPRPPRPPCADGERLLEVHFTRNEAHWDKKAGGNIRKLVIKILPSLEAVAAHVANGSVDVVHGIDTVDPKWFRNLHTVDDDSLQTFISGPLSTRFIMLNAEKAPLGSLVVRKAIMHAIDKQVRRLSALWAVRLRLQLDGWPPADACLYIIHKFGGVVHAAHVQEA
jgi:hypothetical protein